jgi:uncharacterized protein YggE
MKTKKIIGLILIITSTVFISCNGHRDKMESPKKIEVIGSAEMEVVPNELYMTFTLKEYLDATRKKVKLEEIKSDFLLQCKTAGVIDSNISISSYTGNERWDYYWYKRRKKEPDFMSSISYAIKVSSIDVLDRIVDGLNEQSIENFYISKTSHSDIEQLRQQVKTNALIASKNKASHLAKSIGEELGETLIIQEIDDSYRGYYSNEMNAGYSANQSAVRMEATNSATPDFQKIKLRYEMKVVFKLK